MARLDVTVQSLPYLRLYGVALLARLVGYSSAFSLVADTRFPWGIVGMGIVSNGLGAVMLVLTGAWRNSPVMTGLIATIALALIACALNPAFAMAPL